ncbi:MULTISPECIES: ABC transporter ATP-binding protein [unclassified Cellulomonas]|uniref:ABC transporter ATP-binding protein n=1 Tax=unclassified Cellulomonas TaxID=2620175 RepID=UPI00142389F1|nr:MULTISPECIES: ABC transporter ATP-binding protein [unclassified Cellulomonas]NHT19457.1 ABC transporter ATP-binding protein [Cellulomonas sp. IC4_254]HYQ76804.1 ABC transporter ATP-binding protein [Cellulomonas sp.]
MTDVAIRAAGVGKSYRIATSDDAPSTAAEAVLQRLRHPLQRAQYEEFRALDDVSFEIPRGEAVGILGRNGAGKSTLLKLLTRVAAPTRGRIELAGRVGSLLEVGTGFHPELTGRENVFLNGTLLGMRKSEIKQRFDEIVAFSGVEKFLDTPVKRYSSGMYVRLAFAVAAHLDTEILAVDEVLAVGDAEFQAKCLDRMRTVASEGRTVLYVSHQVQTVKTLCTSAIFLEHGNLVMHGTVDDAIELYQTSRDRVAISQTDIDRRPGTGEVRITSATVSSPLYKTTEPKTIEFLVSANADYIGKYFVSCHINDRHGTTILQCDSRVSGLWLDPAQEQKIALTIKEPWLKPGEYTVDLFVCSSGVLDSFEGAGRFEIHPVLPYPQAVSDEGLDAGLVLADFDYERR